MPVFISGNFSKLKEMFLEGAKGVEIDNAKKNVSNACAKYALSGSNEDRENVLSSLFKLADAYEKYRTPSGKPLERYINFRQYVLSINQQVYRSPNHDPLINEFCLANKGWFNDVISGIKDLPSDLIMGVLTLMIPPVYADDFPNVDIDPIKYNFSSAQTIPSPIILDLDGDGVETTNYLNNSAYFDHAADGFAEKSGWVGADDGLLVRDINGDGVINSGRELFGSETLLANGSKAANGFVALSELDSNGDGMINASDTAWNTLKIWRDADGDGVTDSGELMNLTADGVQSINVNYTTSNLTDTNGNQHRQVGNYTTTANQTRSATDVWFLTNPTHSIATETVEVSAGNSGVRSCVKTF